MPMSPKQDETMEEFWRRAEKRGKVATHFIAAAVGFALAALVL